MTTHQAFSFSPSLCKMDFFCNTKDRTLTVNQSFVSKFTCRGYEANNVGKTKRTLHE